MAELVFHELVTYGTHTLLQYLEEGNYPVNRWSEIFQRSRKQLEIISAELTKTSQQIYPPLPQVFRLFYSLPPEKVRVVILGQDPYHNGSAEGYAFSVREGCNLNPSLRNIYKELEAEGFTPKKDGNLEPWVRQGVFLLNTALTVLEGQPESHLGVWIPFTEEILHFLSSRYPGIIWLLWGAKAQDFRVDIRQPEKHHILVTSHPSPLSAHRGFFGCGHFREVNRLLTEKGEEEIRW